MILVLPAFISHTSHTIVWKVGHRVHFSCGEINLDTCLTAVTPKQLAHWPTDIFIHLSVHIIAIGTKTRLSVTLFVSLILENVSILTNELPNLVAPFLATHTVPQLVQTLLSLKWQLLCNQHSCLHHYLSCVVHNTNTNAITAFKHLATLFWH